MTINQANNDADGNTVDDFDAAMDEIAAGTQSPANAADNNADAPIDDNADDDQPLGSNPDGEPPAAASAPASEQPSDDIWKDVPLAVREYHEKQVRDLNYKLGSSVARQSALDRKITELMKGDGAQPADDGSAGDTDGGGITNRFESPEIVKLKEDYGDIAAPLIGLIQEQADQIAKLSAPVQALETGRTEAARLEQWDILAKAHPDFRQLSNDERWGGWIQTQPRAVQEAYQRNIDVTDGQEAAFVLDLFKKDMGITAAPPPPSVDPRRQRQLDAGRDGGRSGGQPTTNEVPDDFDAALDVAMAQAEKRRQKNRVTSM